MDQCSDGFDNDGDDTIDCDETECVSSLESCGMLSGPITVGLGAEAPLLTFDTPMATRFGEPSAPSLMVLDVNGDSGQDDLVVGRGVNIAIFRNETVDGYLSLPRDPAV